jgi:hypothetical protein
MRKAAKLQLFMSEETITETVLYEIALGINQEISSSSLRPSRRKPRMARIGYGGLRTAEGVSAIAFKPNVFSKAKKGAHDAVATGDPL